mgnify:CR=1 FL=1
MADALARTPKTVLDPGTRIAEVLFGLIMVLTFTGSLSVAEAGGDDVRMMLIGALGCNIAWGTIDGIFYLMGCVSEKGQGIRSLRAVRNAAAPAEAHQVIAAALPPLLAATPRMCYAPSTMSAVPPYPAAPRWRPPWNLDEISFPDAKPVAFESRSPEANTSLLARKGAGLLK